MQREIRNEVHIGATVSPFDSISKSSAIDRTAWQLVSTGTYDADIARYVHGTLDFVYQGMIEDIDTKEKKAHITHKDMEQPYFQILLTDNYYVNSNFCFPVKIKKKQL